MLIPCSVSRCITSATILYYRVLRINIKQLVSTSVFSVVSVYVFMFTAIYMALQSYPPMV